MNKRNTGARGSQFESQNGRPARLALGLLLLVGCLASTTQAGFDLFNLNPFAGLLGAKEAKSPPSGPVSIIEAPFLELLKGLGAGDPSKQYVRKLLDEQESFDFEAQLSTEEILLRSGFKFEIHNCTSVDGYVTQMVRIVNPLVAREHLRRIPVVLYAGQGTSPAAFLMASLGSNRPAKWVPPATLDHEAFGQGGGQLVHKREGRDKHEGQMREGGSLRARSAESDHLLAAQLTEANRSLAVVLSNNGYDVWMVPTRGIDKANRKRVESSHSKTVKRILSSKLTLLKNMIPKSAPEMAAKQQDVDELPLSEKIRIFAKNLASGNYWSFSNDEIIDLEFEIQLEKIRMCTKSEKLSLITYSNGGLIAFGFLSRFPGYAQKHLDVVISLAPAVYVNKFNLALGLSGFLSNLNLPMFPYPEETIHSLARTGFVHLCRSKVLRYSLCKVLLDQLYGSSDLFETHLELAIFDYIGRPQSAFSLRHTLQASYGDHLREYDHGLVGNLILYGQLEPRDYELAAVNHPRNYIFAGEKDAIVDDGSLTKLVTEIGEKPEEIIKIQGYNHLDLLVGHDNALKVNKPILQTLNDRYLELAFYVEEKERFGAEEMDFDTSHNRLHGPETGSKADRENGHALGGEHEPVLVAGSGFTVDQSHLFHSEFDTELTRAHSQQEPVTESGNHHEGHPVEAHIDAAAAAAPVVAHEEHSDAELPVEEPARQVVVEPGMPVVPAVDAPAMERVSAVLPAEEHIPAGPQEDHIPAGPQEDHIPAGSQEEHEPVSMEPHVTIRQEEPRQVQVQQAQQQQVLVTPTQALQNAQAAQAAQVAQPAKVAEPTRAAQPPAQVVQQQPAGIVPKLPPLPSLPEIPKMPELPKLPLPDLGEILKGHLEKAGLRLGAGMNLGRVESGSGKQVAASV